jgi:asparagine synthase (glutamine-hydrolysing)
VTAYFSVADLADAGHADPLTDADAAVEILHQTLRAAVKDQMIADVPLGAFLSGGVDSSLIVALMRSVSDRPVKTFTLGFEAPEFNEAVYAKAVAAHLGTEHTEHYVTAADAQAVVPQLGGLYDEPFADASQIPTYLISKMAREHVTVCLTGDAGDEMFAGYVRYPGVPRLWSAVGKLPFRGAASRALAALPLGFVNTAMAALGPLARQYTSRGKLAPAIRKAARWLPARDQDDLFERTMTAWHDPDSLLVDPPVATAAWRPVPPKVQSPLERMVWRDTVDYLPGDILCKVDRAAMAVALETRVPLLDPRVAALAWRAPDAMKIRDGETKWLMRRVLDKYVPRALIDRPKMGFSVPLHDWLTGDLRAWADGLLDPVAIVRQGVLQPKVVAKAWAAYLAGDSSLDHMIWTLLMFQAWMAARGR